MRSMIGVTAICGVVALAILSTVRAEEAPTKLRVGTYDNRAIAVAYASSKYNPVSEKMEEYEKAKATGDVERAKEMEAWGKKHQRQLHRQGFARVPADELKEHDPIDLDEIERQHVP